MANAIASSALVASLTLGPVLPALALECSKASTAEDKAICSYPQAVAADDAMVKAYQALAARLADADKKMLLQSQRAWLKTRANSCADKTGAAQSQCLREVTEQRRAFLQGLPVEGPGSGGKLAPVFIQKPVRKGDYALDVAVAKYMPPTTPAEKLFNGEVDKLLKDVPPRKDEELERDVTYSYDLHLSVVYASPQFISAHVDSYLFSGGAHGSSETSNINIDATDAKILDFGGVFASTSEPKILAECMRQILAQKAERMGDEKIEGDELKQLRASVGESLRNLGTWSFSPRGASVVFDPDTIGAHAEGAYACEFEAGFLKPLVKTGFALP